MCNRKFCLTKPNQCRKFLRELPKFTFKKINPQKTFVTRKKLLEVKNFFYKSQKIDMTFLIEFILKHLFLQINILLDNLFLQNRMFIPPKSNTNHLILST